MASRQLLLLHGYSDSARSFGPSWIPILTGSWASAPQGSALRSKHDEWTKLAEPFEPYDPRAIFPVTYESLVNEVSIDDIAEGLQNAIAKETRFDPERDFDAIVHSTGMLVLRAWLTRYPKLLGRLKHVVGLAPASFGSPLAHKGRSWLARAFKGNRELGPDFLDTGDRVLDALELGSRFTWDLAHQDLFAREAFYGGGGDKPYLFTLCGQRGYDGIERVVNQPGTDGTVRRSGVSLDALKLRTVVDEKGDTQLTVASPGARTAPVWLTAEDNHSTILVAPSVEAIGATLRALSVTSLDEYSTWARAAAAIVHALPADQRFQQIVVRALDDQGTAIGDFDVHIELEDSAGARVALTNGNIDVHNYSEDSSFRCFHVNHGQLQPGQRIHIELNASSGTRWVDVLDPKPIDLGEGTCTHEGANVPLFYPFTTTLIEVVFERRPAATLTRIVTVAGAGDGE